MGESTKNMAGAAGSGGGSGDGSGVGSGGASGGGTASGGGSGSAHHRRRAGRRLFSDRQWAEVGDRLGLSPRELQIVRLFFDGHAEQRMAYVLGLSPHTVHTYVKRIHAKLEVSDQRELLLRVMTEHLIRITELSH